MFFYNVSKEKISKEKFVLSHFGSSPDVSADRVDGMFAHQNSYMIKGEQVNVININGVLIEKISIPEFTKLFSEFAKRFYIYEYQVKTERSLRLLDLWEDDPIGSAGPEVVDTTNISPAELSEVYKLFEPFNGLIYIDHVELYIRESLINIKELKRKRETNRIFSSKLKERKNRSIAIGEEFLFKSNTELVWQDLTFKLKDWAISRGYDSFVYKNTKEGNGADTYITLFPDQGSCTGKVFKFCEHKYLAEMPSFIEKLYRQQNSHCILTKLMWGQQDPMRYWVVD
ncbi:hypothetical protein HG547_01915 [Shewanella sp. DNRA4]|uniref:hypothetical protein n=1 Tax=Shewanella sp. DNRA4 TaxID=2723055 RepID=UPI00146CF841|nr:hypothetical protein [Shewanella sp. DNRA4]NMD50394.1 hypothetical protein [Shewanella sp. DNRA4]